MAELDPNALNELDRQLERASLFTHACLERVAGRASAIEAKLDGLIDLLRASGALKPEGAAGAVDPEPEAVDPEPEAVDPEPEAVDPEPVAVDPELESAGPAAVPWPAFALRADGEQTSPPVEVNCVERMHVCHAVCCKLSFALTAQEVDAGAVRFDLGFPYMIRHSAEGYCSHNDRTTGFCGVYQDRPAICGRYSCAGDGRIWKDFEAMELNDEWLKENLGPQSRTPLPLAVPPMQA